MLVAPHQFATPVYASIRPHLNLWGIGFVLAGVGLLALIGFPPGRSIRIGVHLFSGAASDPGFGFCTGRRSSPRGLLRCPGAGPTGLAAFVPGRRFADLAYAGRDLHIITVGAAATLIGASMLALPDQFGASYDAIRSILPLYGIAFLASGALLLYTQFSIPSPALTFWVADLAAAATLIAFMIQTAIPRSAWTGIVLFGASAVRAAGHSLAGAAARATGGHVASRSHRVGIVCCRNAATGYSRLVVRASGRSGCRAGDGGPGAAPGHRRGARAGMVARRELKRRIGDTNCAVDRGG